MKMFTLDHGCLCKWRNAYAKNAHIKLVGWQYVEKGARFGTDSLLLHLDPVRALTLNAILIICLNLNASPIY